MPQTAIHMGARRSDGTDVVIRVLTRAGEGHEFLNVLRALSSPSARLDPHNRALPMIDELEGFAYLHGQRIAHRDFAAGEVYINYGTHYFLNDFEWSIQFPEESEPASRLVMGIPLEKYGVTLEEYNRPLPPEVLTGQPYCPFAMDVYQLGKALHPIFEVRSVTSEIIGC
ncbi:hypothetical protein RQP46_006668 [Phenoliferia psychrophenolica]